MSFINSSFMIGFNKTVSKGSFTSAVYIDSGGAPPPIPTSYLITENGEYLIDENGNRLIYAVGGVVTDLYISLDDGSFLVNDSGDNIIFG